MEVSAPDAGTNKEIDAPKVASPTSRTTIVKLALDIDGLGLVNVLDVVGEDVIVAKK